MEPVGRLRLLGSVVAGSLASTAAAVSYWLNLYWWNMGIGPVALIGIGVGLAMGFISGPAAVTVPRPAAFALVVAVKAALLGFAVLWSMSLAGAAVQSSPGIGGTIVDAVWFAAFGVPTALAFALPVTMPIAFLSTAVLRLWTRSRAPGRAAIAAVLATTAFSGGVAVAVPRPDLAWGLDEVAPVHVEWTVANHSPRFLELGIFDRDGDRSYGGSVAAIEPCFIATGRDPLGSDWFLTLEPRPERGDPVELVSEAEASGADVQVWIVVAADGTPRVELGRAAPSAEEQTVDLCGEGADR